MKKYKKILVVLLALCMAVSLCACGNSDTQTQSDSANSQSSENSGLAIVIKDDGTVKLATDAPVGIDAESVMAIQGVEIPEDVDTTTLTYSSSDPSIATVDALGHITPVGEGSCTITVEGKTVTVSSDDAEGMCAKGDMVVSNADMQTVGEMGFSFMANETVTTWKTGFGIVSVKHIETSEGEAEDVVVCFDYNELSVGDYTDEQKEQILAYVKEFVEELEAKKVKETVEVEDTVEIDDRALMIDDNTAAAVVVNPSSSASKSTGTTASGSGTSSSTTTPKAEKIVKGVLEYEGDIVRNTETGVTVDLSKVSDTIKKLYSNARYATYLTFGYTEAATGTKHVIVNGVEYAGTGVNPWQSDSKFMAEVGDSYTNDYDSACEDAKLIGIEFPDGYEPSYGWQIPYGFHTTALPVDTINHRYERNEEYKKQVITQYTFECYYLDPDGTRHFLSTDENEAKTMADELGVEIAYDWDVHIYDAETKEEFNPYDKNAPVTGDWEDARYYIAGNNKDLKTALEYAEYRANKTAAAAAVAKVKAENAKADGSADAEELATATETAKTEANIAKVGYEIAKDAVEKAYYTGEGIPTEEEYDAHVAEIVAQNEAEEEAQRKAEEENGELPTDDSVETPIENPEESATPTEEAKPEA